MFIGEKVLNNRNQLQIKKGETPKTTECER